MMMNESVAERLVWFKGSCFQESCEQLVVIEDKKEGYAEIICDVRRHSILFSMEKFVLPALRNRKPKNFDKEDAGIQCADAIIFEKHDEESWNLHIMECKKSISDGDKWKDIKEQFEGAILNAYALMGILGIQKINQTTFYTAHRTDTFTEKLETNPNLFKASADGESNRNIEWMQDRVNVFSLKDAPHVKVKLDGEGKGQIQLS
ncbi:MAG: hypothetical protein ACXVP2_06270 [Tumebacillaceae bacterium]